MPPIQLERHSVHKIWGRRDVPDGFGPVESGEEPLGEVWYQSAGGADEALLVKYLFTSERLSIQVHPDDALASRAGYRRGKDEAWIILAAQPGAEIGVGLTRSLAKSDLRAAALDGSLEELVDWRPAKAGDILYSPAGTIHALGPGLTLIEVQQNVDLTYRLYDYGRPRELHLDAGIEAADPRPYSSRSRIREVAPGRQALVEGPKFVVERLSGCQLEVHGTGTAPVWLIPVFGNAEADGAVLNAGEVYLLREQAALTIPSGSELLIAYEGSDIRFF